MRRSSWRPGRQTPKVKGGKTQKKNRWDRYVREYPETVDGELPIIVEPAIRGFRHPVSETELRQFIEIIPSWQRYSVGLHCLVLGEGDHSTFGWHNVGIICLHAWESFAQEWSAKFFEETRHTLKRLQVPYEIRDDGWVDCHFTRKTACGFQLMDVFLHEVGHHYDRMLTKDQTDCPRGEVFAEGFSTRIADTMWDAFFRRFDF